MQTVDIDDTFELRRFSALMDEADEHGVEIIREHLEDLIEAAANDLCQMAVLLYGSDFMVSVSEMSEPLADYLIYRAQLPLAEHGSISVRIEQHAYRQGRLLSRQDWGTC